MTRARPHRSIFLKFLAAQLPAFLILLAVGLHYLADARIRSGQEQMGARLGAQAGRIAGLLADLDLQSEAAAANQFVSLLMTDRAVACVEIRENGGMRADVSAPRRVGCRGATVSQYFTVPIGQDDAREIRIGVSTAEIDQIRNDARDFGWLIVCISLALASIAGSFAFQSVVVKPLRRLLDAIHAISRTGAFSPIDNRANDEIGAVISSFNDMQEALRDERERVCEARDRIDRIYNTTPTLLFSMNCDGVLKSVSDFSLDAIGYGREAIVGQPFPLLLSPRSREPFAQAVLARLREGASVRDAPLEIVRKDGRNVDVLLSATPDPQSGATTSFVCVMTDVTHLRQVERQLRELALTDYLTKLPNRLGMAERLRALASIGPDKRGLIAIMLIDLDDFKHVNDTYGHEAGDALLVETSRRIRSLLRTGDMAARLGGDEFAIVFASLKDRREAAAIAKGVIGALSQSVDLGEGRTGNVGASVGVALTRGALDVESLMRQADAAMYQAKFEGKNRFAVHGEDASAESGASGAGAKTTASDSRAA